MAVFRIGLLLTLCIFISDVYCATFPTGCSYVEEMDSVHLYVCDYGSVSMPLTYNTFSNPIPQWIQLNNINGAFSFSGFASYDMTQLNRDKYPTLQLHCASGGSISLSSGVFTDMGYIEELEIVGCTSTFAASSFEGFGTLNKLTIKGGTISTFDAATFSNLHIAEVDNFPRPRGELIIQDLTIPSFPAGVFDTLNSTRWIRLENLALATVDAALFTQVKTIRGISLRDNNITTIPDALFTGLDGLSEFDQTNLAWSCSCENLWFWKHSVDNNVTLVGSPVCSTPVDYKDKKVGLYYDENCVSSSICDGTIGIAMGGSCLPIGRLLGLIFVFLALVFTIVALILVLHVRKTHLLQPKRGRKAPPPPGSKPRNAGPPNRRGSGWI